MNLSRIFKEQKYKDTLKLVNLCECVTISMVYVISLHLETPPTIILTLLKNLLMYAHQNYLIIVKLILSRLPQESRDNVWAYTLKDLIESKNLKDKKKADLFKILAYSLSQQIKIIEKLCKGRLTLQQL
jgi:hypothetical protein